MASSSAWLLALLFALAAVGGPRVTAMTYDVTTHYLDADTSCSGTPYRMEVWESTECSEASCAASVNGLYDGVASTVCTEDYQNQVWEGFGSAVYILQVVFHDSACSNFAYARAYLATGECLVGSTSNWFTAKIETNGSATLQFFTTESCSPDDLFLSTERAPKELLESNECDGSEYEWLTNQGKTSAPLVSPTMTSSSNSAATEGTDTTDTTGTTSTDTTTTDSTTDTNDAATSPGTSTSASSSSDGGSSLSVGGIVGIVTGALVSLALAYALIFHKDRPIFLNCCSNSVT
jgi:hypothetical protein